MLANILCRCVDLGVSISVCRSRCVDLGVSGTLSILFFWRCVGRPSFACGRGLLMVPCRSPILGSNLKNKGSRSLIAISWPCYDCIRIRIHIRIRMHIRMSTYTYTQAYRLGGVGSQVGWGSLPTCQPTFSPTCQNCHPTSAPHPT